MRIVALASICFLIISGYSIVAVPNEYQTKQISCRFSSLTINEIQDHTTLELEGTNNIITNYNNYLLPTRIETITFPQGTHIKSINCYPGNIQTEYLDKDLLITPEPVSLSYDLPQIKTMQSEPITINEWYTYTIGSGIINQNRTVILKIELYPIQYNNKESLIHWAEKIDINIEYQIPESSNSNSNTYDFVILSPSTFSDELEPLVAHKNERELKTKSVTLDEIYDETYFPVDGRDDPEKIKYFIKNSIEQWGIHSVLLVGGYDLFPTRQSRIYVEYFDVDEPIISDLYYADIFDADGNFESWDTNDNNIFGEFDWGASHSTDEVDLYPDVYIGRLACVDISEVVTCVNKIITYESEKAFSKDWFTNLVVTGGDTFTEDTWGIDEGEYVNQQVIDLLNGFIPNKIWISNERLSGSTGSNEITDAINNGCGFVHFSGHGDPRSWATHPHEDEQVWLPKPWGYFNSNIMNLENQEKLPIVVLDACSTCKFNVIDNCLGWSFLSNPNGGGIGSFGVTTYGYAFGGGKKISEGFIGEMVLNIFEAYASYANQQKSITFGDLWNHAITEYIHPNMEVRDFATIESWQSFGDPTLMISGESRCPEKPLIPSGPEQIKPGISYSYSSSTTDVDGDLIYYLFDWGDDEISEWLGPYDSGETIEATHTWQSKGRYQIKVKAKDEHGLQSEWSDPLAISISKIKPFNAMLSFKLKCFDYFSFFRIIQDFRMELKK